MAECINLGQAVLERARRAASDHDEEADEVRGRGGAEMGIAQVDALSILTDKGTRLVSRHERTPLRRAEGDEVVVGVQ